MRLTIAAYNAENLDLGGEGEPQHANVARFARDEEVDVLVLEEVQNDAAGEDEGELTNALEDISYPMAYRAFSSASDGFNSIGAWSRLPLSDSGEILGENTRTVLRFKVASAGRSIFFYGCHLKSGGDEASEERRRDEAKLLADYLIDNHDPASEDIVVLGDMNTTNPSDFEESGAMGFLTLTFDADETNDLTAVNHSLLAESPTYPPSGEILDHIILSPSAMSRYVPGSIRVPTPKGDKDSGPSDHLPVVLDLAY